VAEWIQKCSFVAGGDFEQMDAKVLLMLAVITDPPGRPLAILDASGSGTVRGRAGKTKHLGCFKTPEEASAVYEKKAEEVRGVFYCATNV
jgi:hypothetical protein